MGLIDLPGPLYGWIDGLLAGLLPPLARILLWGVIGGLVSMGLYALLAPQERIARGKREAAEARQTLEAHDGTLADAGPLIGRMLRLSVGQVRLTTVPAVVASLPLLTMLAWMSTAYGHRYPAPGEAPTLETRPRSAAAEWLPPPSPGAPPGVLVRNGDGAPVARVPLRAPVTVLHPWQWWNLVLGNPAGYLPGSAPVQRVEIDLPKQKYLAVGPGWARGWELPFFTAVVVASIVLKVGARIE